MAAASAFKPSEGRAWSQGGSPTGPLAGLRGRVGASPTQRIISLPLSPDAMEVVLLFLCGLLAPAVLASGEYPSGPGSTGWQPQPFLMEGPGPVGHSGWGV